VAANQKHIDLQAHHRERIEPLWRQAPFVLRITEWKDYPVPVLAVKERRMAGSGAESNGNGASQDEGERSTLLVERGHLYGEAQRCCLPILQNLVATVCDDAGVPLELQRYLTPQGLRLRVNLPLNEEAGAKIALICRLQERVNDRERVELIARRVARFTREEAAYWLSRMTSFSDDAKRWAVAGLRLMLGGQPKDPGVERMLERLRG
jgi:hypothetical protein